MRGGGLVKEVMDGLGRKGMETSKKGRRPARNGRKGGFSKRAKKDFFALQIVGEIVGNTALHLSQ